MNKDLKTDEVFPKCSICANCCHLENSDEYECRLNPPILVEAYEDGSWACGWPSVPEYGWCSKFSH